MADKNLQALPAVGTLAGAMSMYIVDGDGNSREVTLAELKTFINTDPTIVPSSEPWRGARVNLSANVSIANSTLTSLSWAAEDEDTDNIWAIGAPTRLIVPTGVTRVRLKAHVEWASSGSGLRQISLIKNGASFAGRGSTRGGNSGFDTHIITESADVAVTAGDYFEAQVIQTSGGALNVVAGDRTWFEMVVVEGTI